MRCRRRRQGLRQLSGPHEAPIKLSDCSSKVDRFLRLCIVLTEVLARSLVRRDVARSGEWAAQERAQVLPRRREPVDVADGLARLGVYPT